MEINDRLRILMDNFQLSSSQFADKLEIQRSAISHLLSGRNKPSILMLEKILKNFPDVDIEWLITGKGNIFKLPKKEKPEVIEADTEKQSETDLFSQKEDIEDEVISNSEEEEISKNVSKNNQIEKIIIIFQDKTFEVLEPKNQ